MTQEIENTESSSLRNGPAEYAPLIETDDFASIPTNEVYSIEGLPSSSTTPPVRAFLHIAENATSNEKSYTSLKTRPKKAPVPCLSSSSCNKLSPASRLTNIEGALNNLISCVNTLSEDVASIAAQLKPLSKNVKIIQNHIVPRASTDIVATPPSLRSSAASSSSATMPAKKVLMFKDTNLTKLKHDLTSIRSFLRKMTMTIYTRGEILANKHLDDKEDRYMTII
ncbi:unnamed protein product, partial [Didymodactylos carnosus]